MPTYLYKCTECGHRFEHAQGFHDDPLDTCPDCGGAVRRVIGNVGVSFKGSGFYRNDSRSEKRTAAKSSSGKATPDTGSSSGTSEKSTKKDSGASSGSGSSGSTGSSGSGSTGAGGSSGSASSSGSGSS